jgi:hypothetical protein
MRPERIIRGNSVEQAPVAGSRHVSERLNVSGELTHIGGIEVNMSGDYKHRQDTLDDCA